MKKLLSLLLVTMIFAGCKKKANQDDEDKQYFEVSCNGCTINYTNDNREISTVSNVKSSFKKEYKSALDLEISVKIITKVIIKIYHGSYSFSKEYNEDVYLTYSKSSRQVNDGSSSGSGGGSYGCGLYNGKTLYLGSRGGCYYLTSGGNKSYVDRSYCKCN